MSEHSKEGPDPIFSHYLQKADKFSPQQPATTMQCTQTFRCSMQLSECPAENAECSLSSKKKKKEREKWWWLVGGAVKVKRDTHLQIVQSD